MRDFAQLAPLRMFLSEVEKINAIVTSTSRIPLLSTIMLDYKKENPDLAIRTFRGLTAYVSLHLPNATAQQTAYANQVAADAREAHYANLEAQNATLLANAAAAATVPSPSSS